MVSGWVVKTSLQGEEETMESLIEEVLGKEPAEASKKREGEIIIPQEKKGEDEDFGLDVKAAKIVVVGCGGAGNNAVTRLTEMGIQGASTVAINTDLKHLKISRADKRILIGKQITRGLGAGGYPHVGKKAAEESLQELKATLEGADMVYVVTGLGGGTGTGSAPVVSKLARELGAIVIGFVTMPFKIEGSRMGKAEDGLYNLRQFADTVIVVENDKLLKIAGDMPLQKAFAVADGLVSTIIKGITETIATPSLVNLDYADVKTIMHSGGVAAVGMGESNTSSRAEEAVTKAMENPLLDISYEGGRGALVHVTGGEDLKLEEVNLIGDRVSRQLDPDAQVIWGARIDPKFSNRIRVITIVTGVKSPFVLGPLEDEDKVKREIVSSGLGIPMLR